MRKIKLIKGYEKIAAGEVIERPASVVKELLENSLDAGAHSIFFRIEKAGKELIEVVDDGCGIPEDEVEIAFQRHTSSKIESAEQLSEISTLGFRGEALASIAAVSIIEIITRPKDQPFAIKCILKEGKVIKKEKIGAPPGTTIRVKNLFFNMPVRKKFLGSDRVEKGHISEILSRYALAYPHIHFKLIQKGLTLLNSPQWKGKKNIKKDIPFFTPQNPSMKVLPIEAYGFAIQTIYGKRISSKMYPIHFQDNELVIWGYVGSPEIARADRNAASLFVNFRLVTHKGIQTVIENAYTHYVMKQKHPFYVLFFLVPPSSVDFNVHPTKKIIKFLDEQTFLIKIQKIFNNLIKEKILNPLAEESEKSKENTYETKIIKRKKEEDQEKRRIIDDIPEDVKEYIENSTQQKGIKKEPKQVHLKLTQKSPRNTPPFKQRKGKNEKRWTTEQRQENQQPGHQQSLSKNIKEEVQIELEQGFIQTQKLPPLNKLTGGIQAGNTYLIFQNDEGIVIIDQHAAHERINLEKIEHYFNSKKIEIQKLLIPIKMEVPLLDVDFVKESIDELKKYGFHIEFFGGTTFIVRAVPSFIKKINDTELILDLCREIIQLGKEQSFSQKKREIIQYMACHKSIRAGDEIFDNKTIKRLIEELDKCKDPFHCAHGRPTFIEISFYELEKRFHRKL